MYPARFHLCILYFLTHSLFLSLFCNLSHFLRRLVFRVSVSSTSLSLWYSRHFRIFSANFCCHLLLCRRIFNFSFLDRALFRFLIFAFILTPSLSLFYFLLSIRLFIRFHSPIIHTFMSLHADLFLALSAFPSVY